MAEATIAERVRKVLILRTAEKITDFLSSKEAKPVKDLVSDGSWTLEDLLLGDRWGRYLYGQRATDCKMDLTKMQEDLDQAAAAWEALVPASLRKGDMVRRVKGCISTQYKETKDGWISAVNPKLCDDRCEAVKDYLVLGAGLDKWLTDEISAIKTSAPKSFPPSFRRYSKEEHKSDPGYMGGMYTNSLGYNDRVWIAQQVLGKTGAIRYVDNGIQLKAAVDSTVATKAAAVSLARKFRDTCQSQARAEAYRYLLLSWEDTIHLATEPPVYFPYPHLDLVLTLSHNTDWVAMSAMTCAEDLVTPALERLEQSRLVLLSQQKRLEASQAAVMASTKLMPELKSCTGVQLMVPLLKYLFADPEKVGVLILLGTGARERADNCDKVPCHQSFMYSLAELHGILREYLQREKDPVFIKEFNREVKSLTKE